MRLGILKSTKELNPLVDSYIKACDILQIEYVVLDLLCDDWISTIKNANVDGILVRTRGTIQEQKSMFDERLYVISNYLKIPIYPSWKELYLYENKRMYSYYCQTHNISHPKTHIFYRRKDALDFVNNSHLPLVFKTNGGAGGSGVDIVRSKAKAKWLIYKIFGFINPRLTFGYVHWGKYKGLRLPKFGMSQKHYAIIQEFIDIETEWRIFKIGDTYGGYQRPMENGHGSCDAMVYGFPPKHLLHLLKNFCDTEQIRSMSFDVIIDKSGEYYVTEMQTLYGSFSPVQCAVNNKPGRILFKNDDFIFEEGEGFFDVNSNLLRVSDFINQLQHSNNII